VWFLVCPPGCADYLDNFHNTDAAETFFGMPVPKVPAPNPGSFPQSAPSHPNLENGLSFSNTDDNDNNDNIGESNNNPSVPLSGGITALPHSQMPSDNTSEVDPPTLSPDTSDGDIGQTFEIIKVILCYFSATYAYIYISGFAFIFLGLGHQTMVMSFCTKHVTFGGIYHQRVTQWYSPVI